MCYPHHTHLHVNRRSSSTLRTAQRKGGISCRIVAVLITGARRLMLDHNAARSGSLTFFSHRSPSQHSYVSPMSIALFLDCRAHSHICAAQETRKVTCGGAEELLASYLCFILAFVYVKYFSIALGLGALSFGSFGIETRLL
jgi:hypothetical protein